MKDATLHNLVAEKSLLGGLLHGSKHLEGVCNLLEADCFTRPEHKHLFKAMVELQATGVKPTLLTITDHLKANNGLKRAGGTVYLAELKAGVGNADNVLYWAKKVKEIALKRFAAQGAGILAKYATDPKKSAEEVLEKHREISERLGDRRLHLVSSEDTKESVTPFQFPNVMQGVAGDFATLYSSYLEVPPHFFFMGFLTCLGVVLADRLSLASEIAPQPRLYTILLGESADDRKSTALNKVIEFFKTSLVENFGVCWGIGSAEGLQKRLEESPRLLLCLDEFKQFVSKCKIEASVLLPCVNTLFESNRYESRTKHTDISLENAYLSMLAASTVQTYECTWDPSFTAIGFNNRLFLCPGTGERKFSIPAKVPEDKKHDLARHMADILRLVGPRLELGVTSRARALFDDWYLNMDRSIHTKRLDTYALRLMPLLAVNELKDIVDENIAEQAINLCNWQLEVREALDPIDAVNTIAKMEEKIRRACRRAKRPLKDRDIKRVTNANRDGLWAYMAARKNLISAGEIRFNPKTKLVYWCGQ